MKTLEKIRYCEKCKLCCNQRPLMDRCSECQVLWVGLSAKKAMHDDEIPLSIETNSGAVIHEVEMLLEDVKCYKTNLVKCLPLDEKSKLRYPNQKEIDACFANLEEEIEELSPKIVFLLGEKVYSSVGRHLNLDFERLDGFNYNYVQHGNVCYVPIQHPSYIYVYKRKHMSEYIGGIKKIADLLLSN